MWLYAHEYICLQMYLSMLPHIDIGVYPKDLPLSLSTFFVETGSFTIPRTHHFT